MTEKKVRYIVSRALAATQPVPERHYHICWWEDRLHCHHVHHTKDGHEVFYSAPGQIFLDGLSDYQWNLRILLARARAPGSTLSVYLDRLQRLLETADVVVPMTYPTML